MSYHHQKQGGAGLGAGLDFFEPPKNRKFTKVVDRRGQPLRGLWLRGSTYYARITVEDPDGGKRERRLALDASSLSEAREALARLRAEPPEHNRRKKRVPLFPEFWPTYIEAVRHQKRERTIKSEQVFLRQWEAWLGPIPINRISTAQVIGFRTERLSRGLSGRTANLAVTVLNNLLNHARDLELIQSLPTEGMKPIRWKHKKRPLFTVDDINRLCTAAIGAGRNGQMLSDYLRLMACCGSRRDETLRLRWSDVDWQRQQLWVGADGLAKNHEARVVDFNSALGAHLEAMHNRREQDSVYLFPAPRRGKEDRPARNLKESLRKIRDQAGCPGFGFHDCRHHFISYAVMSGIDYLTIARWVGHKDGGILIGRVYGHLTDVHARKQAQRLQFNV
jgi:integrase